MTIDRTKLRWNGWGWTDHLDPICTRDDAWKWLATDLGMPSLLATPARPLDDVQLPPSALSAKDRYVLGALLGLAAVRESKFERAFHTGGRGYRDLLRLRAGDLSDAPDIVVYPQSSADVLKVLAFAAEREVAVVPYGGGTSVAGGVAPRRNEHHAVLSLDLSEMARVDRVDVDSLTASVEAGISGSTLEASLAKQGLTLGHCPQSFEFSTLGGWIADLSQGQQSLRYGNAHDWLIGVDIATPRGMLRESSATAAIGWPGHHALAAGAGGVFGIVTRATIRLHPLPVVSTSRAYAFRDFESGATAIREAVQGGVTAAMLRLSDPDETRLFRYLNGFDVGPSALEKAIAAFLQYQGYDEPCVLIAEFEGKWPAVSFARKVLSRIAKVHGGIPLGAGVAQVWQRNRFRAPYLRDAMLDRGLGIDTVEAATSWSNLIPLFLKVKAALSEAIEATVPRPLARGIVLCHLAHPSGQGATLSFTYIFPRMLADEIGQCESIRRSGLDAIIAGGGTIAGQQDLSGEHLPSDGSESQRLGSQVLRAIKNSVDPNGILNPGKHFPL